MHADLIYQLALTLVPNIGPVQAKALLQHFDVRDIFRARKKDLERIEGIGAVKAASIKSFSSFDMAEREISFIEKFGIQPIFLTDPAYPRRLLNCYDSPTLLFCRGTPDLNHSRVIAVIGTRSHTEYGRQVTEKIVADLKVQQTMIVSGLAFGIDAIAHRAAIKNDCPTIGVLAHGLDQVYPAQHASLAREMIRSGGAVLTEFRSGIKPDKHNFPTRNRVVAGISDAVIVIETGTKGGSMITAELANSYNRDVFAIPGRVNDPKSAGCHDLIKNNKAVLLTHGKELIEIMGWEASKTTRRQGQRELFTEMNEEERKICEIIGAKDAVHIDEIYALSGLSNSRVAAAILNLELRNVVLSLPGKLYQMA